MKVTNEEFVATLHGYMFAVENYDGAAGYKLNVHKLPINPGDGRMFPWLSAVARRYEHYTFKNLEIIYKPAVSTLASGNVALCPIYDPADTVPTTRTVLLNTDGAIRTQVYNTARLVVPTSRLNTTTKHYIRSQGDHVLDPGELRNTDLGFIAITITDSDNATYAYGDIFVRYTVEFYGPRIGASGSRVGLSHTSLGSKDADWYLKDGVTAPFGNIQARFGSEWTKEHNHPNNTLDYDLGYDDSTYNYGGTVGGASTLVKFNEPFTGLMTINRRHPLTAGAMQPHVVNGWAGYEHDDSGGALDIGQPLKSGQQHKWRKGIANFIGLVKDAGDAVKETWSVICDVGDVLHVTGLGNPSATEETGFTFMEAAEEMLPVFAGVLA